jgi:hypothetical protein
MRAWGLIVAIPFLFLTVVTAVCAESATGQTGEVKTDAKPAASAPVRPVYEVKDGWKFDKGDNLAFSNPSPNPDGARFLLWKDYVWMVTAEQIVAIDLRPNGTQVKGRRQQRTKDDKLQSDKDLMSDLKDQVEDLRKAAERAGSKPASKGRTRIGVGLGF